MINKFNLILSLYIEKFKQQANIFPSYLVGIDEELIPILVFISVE